MFNLVNSLILELVAFILIINIIIQAIARVRHPVRKSIFSMLIGILALAGVNITSVFTGVTVPVSLLSLGVSAAGGIPGVTMLVLMNTLV